MRTSVTDPDSFFTDPDRVHFFQSGSRFRIPDSDSGKEKECKFFKGLKGNVTKFFFISFTSTVYA